jgi:predicted class III extradiol MEMO1 family dioxygenase
MDWKPYYDTELREAKTRDKIKQWLRIADEMAVASGTHDSRTVLSFPHTAVDYSGPLQARVISWLYGNGFKRVIALGVIHGALIPTYQVAANELSPHDERKAAYEQVSGAFLPASNRVKTPFGTLDVLSVDQAVPAEIRQDHSNFLENEFSLDTFHAVMRLAADIYQVEPLPVLPLYVGMMRNPFNGSFATAAALARWLDASWDEETAIVTTGDVVHFGAVYGSENEGVLPETLESRFHHRLEVLFERAFREGNLEAAYQMALCELKSDQREVLLLLAHLLGEGAIAEIDAFTLSDYAPIFNAPPPCLVASALIAYKRR